MRRRPHPSQSASTPNNPPTIGWHGGEQGEFYDTSGGSAAGGGGSSIALQSDFANTATTEAWVFW